MSCLGRRNVKWPEVRLSPTPATPLHPPAASKDPQTPFCVFGSKIQQLIQCMWAILKVLSRSPSSVDFHHIAQRLQRGLGAPKQTSAARTLSDAITCSDSLPLRFFSPSFRLPVWGYSNGKLSDSRLGTLSPRQTAAGVPEALPDGKVYPGLGVKLGNTFTREGKNQSVWPPRSDPNALG